MYKDAMPKAIVPIAYLLAEGEEPRYNLWLAPDALLIPFWFIF
jgi:hypothetical protein